MWAIHNKTRKERAKDEVEKLYKTTGKTLDEWVKIVKTNGPENLQLISAWLQKEHNLDPSLAVFIAAATHHMQKDEKPISPKEKLFISKMIKEGHFFLSKSDIAKLKADLNSRKGVHRLLRYAKARVVHRHMAVGMFDILGFSEMIMKASLDFYDKIVFRLLHSSLKQADFVSEISHLYLSRLRDKDTKENAPKIDVLVFSDTVLIYPRFTENTHGIYYEPIIQILMLARAARYIFNDMLERNILLRGSIAYGECLISRNPIAYLGEPIIEAYKVEKMQKWARILFAPSAGKYLEKGTFAL